MIPGFMIQFPLFASMLFGFTCIRLLDFRSAFLVYLVCGIYFYRGGISCFYSILGFFVSNFWAFICWYLWPICSSQVVCFYKLLFIGGFMPLCPRVFYFIYYFFASPGFLNCSFNLISHWAFVSLFFFAQTRFVIYFRNFIFLFLI